MIHYTYNKDKLADKNILLHHHLGLGDHISLCGLVNHMAEQHSPDKKIFLMCKSNNVLNVQKLYRNNPIVQVVDIKDADEHTFANQSIKAYPELEYFCLGHSGYDASLETKNNWDCNQVFYYLAGVPYEYRFTKFTLPYDEAMNNLAYDDLVGESREYMFVHDDPTRGYEITPVHNLGDNVKVVRNDIRYTIFDYVKILRNAKQIHLMPSSFYCLIESIEGVSADLFCYPIRNGNLGNGTRHRWNIM